MAINDSNKEKRLISLLVAYNHIIMRIEFTKVAKKCFAACNSPDLKRLSRELVAASSGCCETRCGFLKIGLTVEFSSAKPNQAKIRIKIELIQCLSLFWICHAPVMITKSIAVRELLTTASHCLEFGSIPTILKYILMILAAPQPLKTSFHGTRLAQNLALCSICTNFCCKFAQCSDH